MNFPWLTALVAVPTVGALLVGLVPAGRARFARLLALAVALVTLALAAGAATRFGVGGERYQLAETYQWVESLGFAWSLGLDGISLALVALTVVATPVVMLAMWDETTGTGRRPHLYYALVLVLEAMIVGALLATDVLLFYILFEAMLIPMYALIGLYGGPQRRYAAVKFLLYNLVGGLVMLAAVVGLYVESTRAGRGTFSLQALTGLEIDAGTQAWLFLGFMIAFAIKAPLWPLHTWLPDAAGEATPSNAAFLSGVMDKVGTFGMIHLCLPLFPDASRTFAPLLVTLGVVSILYGALLAIGQSDLKRLVAYASISHFGFIVVGIFTLNSLGAGGSTLYMVNHGLSTIALFVVVGFMVRRRGSALVGDYGGLQRPAPVLAGALLVAGLSGLALPGLATFVSEFLVLAGTFSVSRVAGVLGTVGIVLAAVYILLMYQRTMTGPVRPGLEATPDLRGREVLTVAPLFALLLVLGFFPQPLVAVIEHGVAPTLSEVGVEDPQPLVPVPAAAEGTDQ